jgi:demethylmenaquinone methyltransferase/2-methoxy-6-polyprenyl-1,4-benzoquinol methylase
MLRCPVCRGELEGITSMPPPSEVRCTNCGGTYACDEDIPVLLPAHAPAHDHDELDHHKDRQSAYFDRALAEEFETTRPHGTPQAYAWLLERKFRRSIDRLPPLDGRSVLVACCGSGMDAEMLTRAGARVIALDISAGCARRARARARRFGLDYVTVVGDVERLPLEDAAVDIAYVHDGLHHLEAPERGVRELARVARLAVSINEPASAFGTALAVRLGLALEHEEAGNRVARLDGGDVTTLLKDAGFDARASRYLMYYRHVPGAAMRAASHPAFRRAARATLSAADLAVGRWGNKLQVTALRRAA